MATTKGFCARPGCGIARAVHGRMGCGNYIDPDSDAGRAICKAEKAAATAVKAQLRLLTPLPEVEEETVEIDPPTDDQLLADYRRIGEML